MKGVIGPERVRWETDFTGKIWLQEYKGEKFCLAPSPLQVALLEKAQKTYGEQIEKACRKHDLPPSWILGLMVAESGGDPNAKSPAGALGLLQIMPLNANGRNLLDPAQNIDCACSIIVQLQIKGGPWDLMEVGSMYNAGPDPRGGPKTSSKFDFGMINEVGEREVPLGTTRRSKYLRDIAAGNNWAILHPFDSGGAGSTGAGTTGAGTTGAGTTGAGTTTRARSSSSWILAGFALLIFMAVKK